MIEPVVLFGIQFTFTLVVDSLIAHVEERTGYEQPQPVVVEIDHGDGTTEEGE